MFVRINERISVAGQIEPADLRAAADAGFRTVVNNRPDGEAPGQPAGESIEEAATAAGLDYLALPIGRDGISLEMVSSLARLLESPEAPVLAFCRSGNRSTQLWALAAAMSGGSPDEIVTTAHSCGYDVAGLTPILRQLADAAGSDPKS